MPTQPPAQDSAERQSRQAALYYAKLLGILPQPPSVQETDGLTAHGRLSGQMRRRCESLLYPIRCERAIRQHACYVHGCAEADTLSWAQLEKVLRGDCRARGLIRKGGGGKGGRPSDTDHKADAKLAEAWGSGHFRTHAELAREMGMPVRQVKLALERARNRRRRKASSGP